MLLKFAASQWIAVMFLGRCIFLTCDVRLTRDRVEVFRKVDGIGVASQGGIVVVRLSNWYGSYEVVNKWSL